MRKIFVRSYISHFHRRPIERVVVGDERRNGSGGIDCVEPIDWKIFWRLIDGRLNGELSSD
jgi:hypothetical protein